MPPLSQTRRPLPPGYSRVDPQNPPPGALQPSLEPVFNVNTIWPMPPLSPSPNDSARTFFRGGHVPQDRILSVPTLSGNNNNGGVTNQTVNVSGASSSSIVVTLPSAQTASITTPSIAPGVPYTTSIPMAKTFALLQVSVSVPARVELYSTANFQNLDLGRPAFSGANINPPTAGDQHGVIADLYLDTVLTWVMSPVAVGSNADFPQSVLLYITITSIGSTNPVTATMLFCPEET